MNNNAIWVIILIAIFFYLAPAEKEGITITATDDSSIADLIDAGVSFTGINKYVTGTSTIDESVRIFRFDGTTSDLGTKSLNSGTLAVTPNTDYRFYFFFNSTGPSSTYYVDVQDYKGKVQESTDDVVGNGCTIETNPVVSVRSSNGAIQSSGANAESMSAGQTKDVEVTIKSHVNNCYGTPGAPKGNAVCFAYNTAAFTTVKPSTKSIGVPRSIASLDVGTVKCYEFDLLENGGKDILTVALTSNGDPTTAHNISIFTDDIAFDLNQQTSAEIWDFTDESGNQLGHVINATPANWIRVS